MVLYLHDDDCSSVVVGGNPLVKVKVKKYTEAAITVRCQERV